MELGGFEPPTSWVRFTPLVIRLPLESAWEVGLRRLRFAADQVRYAGICGDYRGVQAETL